MNDMSLYLKQPRCIRIFKSYEAAKFAQDVLAKVDIQSFIREDKFGTLTLKELNMQSRFRLYIEMDEIDKAGEFLAKELKKRLPKKSTTSSKG